MKNFLSNAFPGLVFVKKNKLCNESRTEKSSPLVGQGQNPRYLNVAARTKKKEKKEEAINEKHTPTFHLLLCLSLSLSFFFLFFFFFLFSFFFFFLFSFFFFLGEGLQKPLTPWPRGTGPGAQKP